MRSNSRSMVTWSTFGALSMPSANFWMFLIQTGRNKRAVAKLMCKLLNEYGFVSDKLVTDDLRSYGAAASELAIEALESRCA